MNFFLLFLTFTISVSACKTLFDMKNYSKSAAKGSISAKDWIYGYGYTDPEAKLADGQEIMIVLSTSKPKHACPNPEDRIPDTREIAIAIDGKIGEMKLGTRSGKYETEDDMFTYRKEERQASVAFHDPNQIESQKYKFATSGKVKITKITSESIEGAVLAKIDKNYFINGQFKAKICKYGQLN